MRRVGDEPARARLTDRGWWVVATLAVLAVVAVDGLLGGLASVIR